MGTTCAGTMPKMGDNTTPINFTRTTPAWCTSNDGQTLTWLDAGVPRVMTGAVDDSVLGLMNEGHARTNYVFYNHDLSNAYWVKSNMTCAMNATGLKGTSNSASTCTATSNGGTVTGTITAYTTSHEGATSFYIKRGTGTGTVQVSIDGSTYLTDISGQLSSSVWKRYGPYEMVGCTAGTPANSYSGSKCITNPSLHQTLANPVVKIKLGTSGDSVLIDFVQHEEGSNATSPIEVLGNVQVQRDADHADMPIYYDSSSFQFCAAATVVIPGGGAPVYQRLHGVPGDGDAGAPDITLGGSDSTLFDDSYYDSNAWTVEFTNGNGSPSTIQLATGLSYLGADGGSAIRVRSMSGFAPVQVMGTLQGVSAEQVNFAVGPTIGTWTRYRLGGVNATNGAYDGVIKQVEFDPQQVTCQQWLDTAPKSYALALGDSITCCPNGSNVGWPHYANATYAGARQIANLAKGGSQTDYALANWSTYGVGGRYNYVFVLSGTNDINNGVDLGTIEANLQAIYDSAIATHRHVYPMTLVPRGASAGWTGDKQTLLLALNTWIRAYCTAHSTTATCIDLYNSALNDGSGNLAAMYDSMDGLHPNASGEQYIASQVTMVLPRRHHLPRGPHWHVPYTRHRLKAVP